MHYKIDDLRIRGIQEVIPPQQLHQEIPVSDGGTRTIHDARVEIHNILHQKDDRLLVIMGPCSIHDPEAAREYAGRLQGLMNQVEKEIRLVMRVYFEKPRTTVGWKGLINDPDLDGSFQINKGLRLARHLLADFAEMGIPAATEFLDLISPQYLADLISWGAIGARTTESQVHRELASGLSCPVGFKNGTDGSLNIAIDAIRSASQPHYFLSLTKEGHSAIFSTSGNDDCHIILRGGKKPNYDADSINQAATELEAQGLEPMIMVDCSHANSSKDHRKQAIVCRDMAQQLAAGDRRIMGLMMESHLVEGRQDVIPGQNLIYGKSITDACIDWDSSEQLVLELAEAVKKRREVNPLVQQEAG